MRVISGSARGHKLQAVPGDSTRPIIDRVKEALFNIIGSEVIDSTWLDLFGGTGAVGIEALSRGAAQATFVERNQAALKVIRANLAHTKLAERAEVVAGDAFRHLRGRPRPYDFVYVAPPQYRQMWSKALRLLESHPGWLAVDGQVIVQIHPKEFREAQWASFRLDDRRKYGSTLLCFYSWVGDDDAGEIGEGV